MVLAILRTVTIPFKARHDLSPVKEVEGTFASSPRLVADFNRLREVVENHTEEMKELKMILGKLDADCSCDKDELKNLILDMRAEFKNSSSSANVHRNLNKELSILSTPLILLSS